MKAAIQLFIFVTLCGHADAQYFQFSQYNFAQQRINPAMVAASDYAAASLLYRNQSTGAWFNLNSNYFNVSYPLINRRGIRWSGIGLSFLDDRAGNSGLFRTQEAGLSYAININMSKTSSLSLGFRAVHARRQIDLSGLSTGLQYIQDRGFDPALENGEASGDYLNRLFTFSSGLFWQRVDKKGERVTYFGFSFFDFNGANDSFLDQESPYPSSIVAVGSFRWYQRNKYSLFPQAHFSHTGGTNMLNVGFVHSYEINSYRNRPGDRVELITKYAVGRSGIVGIQFHRENFSFGFSYDFPLLVRNVGNTGAFEGGIELRRLVDPKKKIKRKNEKIRAQQKTQSSQKLPLKTAVPKPDTTRAISSKQSNMSERLKQKQDSIIALGKPGQLEHEPLIIEEATLRFGFNFNSSELNEESAEYLDELARALRDNANLKVTLTGHTDNVGSAKFNLRLSIDRANTLKDELVQRGIDAERIEVFGRGLAEPLNDNSTPEKRAENRRVEMKIIYED